MGSDLRSCAGHWLDYWTDGNGRTKRKYTIANELQRRLSAQGISRLTYKDQTVQIDGNNFIDCTFDNVTFRFDGEAPFRFTNSHFGGKFSVTSNNPVVKATIALLSGFIKMESAPQNQSNGTK